MRIYMQLTPEDEKAPRFYQVMLQEDLLQGWTLVREWGQQGSPGRVKKDHFNSRDEALDALLNVRDAQLKRGYRVVFVRGMEQP